MFSGLRQNALIYILNKANVPTLKVGQVVSVSNPMPKYPNTFSSQYMPETVVDIKVKVDDDTMEFRNLPSNATIANDTGMVVSDSREAMATEVETMLRQSKAIIDSVDYHRSLIESCEDIMSKLNPQLAKEKEQADKINALEGKVSGIEGKLDKVITMLSKT